MSRARTTTLVLVAAALVLPSTAWARPVTHLVAVGTNTPPPAWGSALPTLAFADDDALSMATLARELGWKTWLLTVADADSQQRHAAQVGLARPPTVAGLEAVLDEVQRSLAEARARGEAADLVVFLSGHGRRGGLALLDGELTAAQLTAQILARQPARYVHLLVDACHAETVVRARSGEDHEAQVEPVDAATASRWLEGASLAAFPQVGALIATARDAETHEWDLYRRGVFTHQLLSGLRGAADVNGDRRVEYSELAAFITAANREVTDVRARLEVISRAPALDARAPLVDLSAAPTAWLTGLRSSLGRVHVEDLHGTRLADAHAEPGHSIDLVVPSGALRVVAASGEAQVRVPPRERRAIDTLTFVPPTTRTRSGLADALTRGLFVASFGPRYYRGYADQTHAVAVHFDEPAATETLTRLTPPPAAPTWPRWLAFGAAGALAAGAATTGGLALSARADWQATPYQRPAQEARGRYDDYRAATLVLVGGALVSAALGTWLTLDAPE